MDSQTNVGEFSLPVTLSKRIPELKQLENLLTCPICYETVTHPTSTPCHHLFCSLCIRKYLQFKQACPSCHIELHEPQLRQDKTAENILPVFRALASRVGKILDCNSGGTGTNLSSNKGEEKENVSPLQPQNSSSHDVSSASKSNSQNKKEVSPCEVCKVEIPTKNLNLHTEKCRKSAKVGMKKESSFVRKKPPPLPKLVYSLLKENELKKKCKEFGLNPKGDRKLLTSRLQKYTLLYNTELMLENPKSQLQIAMQVMSYGDIEYDLITFV